MSTIKQHEYKAGDKGEAVCRNCRKRVTTTFRVQTVQFAPDVVAQDVIIGVCDECGGIASIPSNSTPKIAEAYRNRKGT